MDTPEKQTTHNNGYKTQTKDKQNKKHITEKPTDSPNKPGMILGACEGSSFYYLKGTGVTYSFTPENEYILLFPGKTLVYIHFRRWGCEE